MSDAIGPGDWVECVNNGPRLSSTGVIRACPELRVGAAYLVIGISSLDSLYISGPGVRRRGDSLGDGYAFAGYGPDRFRPYHGPEQAKRLTSEPISEPA